MITWIRSPRDLRSLANALLFLFVLFIPFITQASSDHLWINQIQITGGSGKVNNDFVEIYNPTEEALDLQGMRLVKRSQTGTTDTSLKSWTMSTLIPAGGYYLWANSSFTDIALAPDATTSATLAADNAIALRLGPNDTGTVIDSVAWGNSTNIFVEGNAFTTNPEANKVLLRTQDTDDNAADFTIADPNPRNLLSVATTPSPDPEPPPAPPPSTDPTPPPPPPAPSRPRYSRNIWISEILANPDGTDSGEEWIELWNSSDDDAELSGWQLDDEGSVIGKSAYKFQDGTIIKAYHYLAIDLSEENFSLNNTGGDSVRLFWPDGQLLSELKYTESAKEDQAYILLPSGLYAWTIVPTKGLPNVLSESEEKILPQIEPKEAEEDLAVPVIPAKIVISELFPEPARNSSQVEFIELFNAGETEIDLTDFQIADKASNHKLNGKLKAGDYFVILKAESNIALNNSGSEVLTLTDPAGQILSAVNYEEAMKDQSYNLLNDGNYAWSTTLTPAAANQITVPIVEVKQVIAKPAKKTAVKQQIEPIPDSLAPATEMPKIAAAETRASSPIISNPTPQMPRRELFQWLIASFALNVIFCYSLVKFMIKKDHI